MSPLLEVQRLTTGYRDLAVLRDVDVDVAPGTITAIIGANGVGKSTLLRAISGILPPWSGEVRFQGRSLAGVRPWDVAALGIAHVPEGRRLFPRMTVAENLDLGAYRVRDARETRRLREWVTELFPILGERGRQVAGTMSGGEQQMLAVGRALMAAPTLLLMDEPTQGLMPLMVDALFEGVRKVREREVTIVIVEQNVEEVLELVDRAYLLEGGRVVLSGAAQDLRQDVRVQEAYLGL
jgi:branched-chain amino acid transport system ATP-binding protein